MPRLPRHTSGLSDLTGTRTLDPRRTMIQFQTKAMWVLNVSGTLRAARMNAWPFVAESLA